jgi:hypothetical protein
MWGLFPVVIRMAPAWARLSHFPVASNVATTSVGGASLEALAWQVRTGNPNLSRAAPIHRLFGRKSAKSVQLQRGGRGDGPGFVQVRAQVDEIPQSLGGVPRGTRGRRFKSCQPDRKTASELRKRRSEAVSVLTWILRMVVCWS